MQFNSKKNKLKFINDSNITTSQNIDNQNLRNNLLTDKVQVNPPSIYLFNKAIDFSTSWVALEINEDLFSQYKVWTFEWDKFDIRLLPYIDVKFMYRVFGEKIPNNVITTPSLSKFFIIKEISGETDDNYKSVKMVSSIYVDAYYEDSFDNVEIGNYYLEGKVNIFFTNPREYR